MNARVPRVMRLAALAVILAATPFSGAAARSGADSLVTGFDLEQCVLSHAAGFEITRLAPIWGAGLEALAVEPGSREILHLTVGVFGSSHEAADAAAARVADFSIRLDPGSLSGKALGDRSWSADLTIVFHRDNVLVQVFGSSRERVQAIAEMVDRELAGKRDTDVERGGRVTRPLLSGVRTPAGNIAVGSDAEIRLTGSTPTGRRLYYSYHPSGGELLGGDPPIPLDDHCVMSPVMDFPVTVVGTGG